MRNSELQSQNAAAQLTRVDSELKAAKVKQVKFIIATGVKLHCCECHNLCVVTIAVFIICCHTCYRKVCYNL